MSKPVRWILFWAPRILSLLFILFVGLFSLDVFGSETGFWNTLVAFLMHNLPTFFLILALVLAWRWEWIGAALYLGFAIWYLLSSWGRFDWTAPALLSGIPALVGLLYLAGWIWRKKIRVH